MDWLLLRSSRCVIIPLAEDQILQQRRQTCWEHLLGSLPLFFSCFNLSPHPTPAQCLNLSLPFHSAASNVFSFLSTTSYSVWCLSFICPALPPSISSLPRHVCYKEWSSVYLKSSICTKSVKRRRRLQWHGWAAMYCPKTQFTLFYRKRKNSPCWNF